VVEAGLGQAAPAGHEPRALAAGHVHVTQVRVELRLIHGRSHLGALEAVADLHLLGARRQALHEGIGDLLVDDHPRGGRAALARRAERAGGRRFNGQIEIRPMMYVALSYDHRIIDGREAVQFLVAIKDGLEDPARLLLGV